jgi:hypothetical protein
MTFHDLLADSRPRVFDGGMGTMLYQKGVFINRCYDELNLKARKIFQEEADERPEPIPHPLGLVVRVHPRRDRAHDSLRITSLGARCEP